MKRIAQTILVVAACTLASVSGAQEPGNHEALTKDDIAKITKSEYSPYAGRNFPTRPLWGDTHLHTAISVDAGTMNRVGQEDAFRFARGEEITTTHGLRAKLSRPLDFIVVSDHAEMYGLMPQLLSGDPEILATELGRRWYEELMSGDNDRIHTKRLTIFIVFNSHLTLTIRSQVFNLPGPSQFRKFSRQSVSKHDWKRH